jgi:hypothetical protein
LNFAMFFGFWKVHPRVLPPKRLLTSPYEIHFPPTSVLSEWKEYHYRLSLLILIREYSQLCRLVILRRNGQPSLISVLTRLVNREVSPLEMEAALTTL